MNEMKRKETCIICGKPIIGYGNDPWPLTEDGRCCDICNEYVLLVRLEHLIKKESYKHGEFDSKIFD